MRRPSLWSRHDRLDRKMTPMIDVIFLLLVFFVCTASFAPPEKQLPTNLAIPGSLADTVPPPDLELEELDQLVIHIGWKQHPVWQLLLPGSKTPQRTCDNLQQLRRLLLAVVKIRADLPVIFDIAPQVPVEHLIDTYDLCRQVGLQRIQFAASTEAP